MSRTQSILSGVLVVQGLLLLIVASPWSSPDASRGSHALIPELESFTPERIEIADGAETLVLAREADAWVVEQADGYPADQGKVDDLLADLEEMEVRRPVVSGSRYHKALKVTPEENERRLRIWASGDEEPGADLLIGTSPNYGVQHVRRIDEDRVYDVRGLSPWDLAADAGSWIDRQLLDIDAETVKTLVLVNGNGRIELARTETGGWESAGIAAEIDGAKVDQFLSSIGSLRLVEPAGLATDRARFGLASPSASLELMLEPGTDPGATVTLLVGGVADEESGKRYALEEGSEFAVVLSKWDAERLLDQALEGWLISQEPVEN